MANLIVSGINSSNGQSQQASSSDQLVDVDGNLILAGGVELISETGSVDGTSTGVTALYTVPSGIQIVVTQVVVRVTAASAVTVVPTLGVGIGAGEDDIVSPQTLTGLSATGDVFTLDVEAKSVIADPSDVINLGIDTGATATTLTLSIDLIGYVVGGSSLSTAGSVISSLYLSSNQSTGTGIDKIDLDTVLYDPFGIADLANNQFTIPASLSGRRFVATGFVTWLSTPTWSSTDAVGIQIMHKDSSGTPGDSSTGDPGLLNVMRSQTPPISGTNLQAHQTQLFSTEVSTDDFFELYGLSLVFASGRAFLGNASATGFRCWFELRSVD